MAAQIREQAGNEQFEAREDTMVRRGSLRTFAASALLLISSAATPTYAADALRIGLSLSLTGPTAPAGKQVLAGLEIWRDDINEKGGLLGRPVELVYYDDQGSPANAPGIYENLMGIDKVDLLIGPYSNSGNGLDQFKDWARQVVVYPREYKAGNLIYPFEKAAQ
jgi:ABC-type branched-subunit amino acid transport system substrate-binding protein